MSIEERVRKIVCEQLGKSVEEVSNDASFVDDVVMPITCSAYEISEKISNVCSIVISVFTMFGSGINFSSGKTEVSICAHGKGSKQVKRKIALAEGAIDVTHKFGSTKLLVVASYKHVGSFFSPIVSLTLMLHSNVA